MSPQFHRLLWKDYRDQRALWLALLLGQMILTVSTMLTFGPSAGLLIRIAGVACAGFVFGSAAMAFSGEEDDGTAIWLRMFPIKTSTLISAKLTMPIVGGLALLMAALGIDLGCLLIARAALNLL